MLSGRVTKARFVKPPFKFGLFIDYLFKLCREAPEAILYASATPPFKMTSAASCCDLWQLEAYFLIICPT